jgi:hypothetical protein
MQDENNIADLSLQGTSQAPHVLTFIAYAFLPTECIHMCYVLPTVGGHYSTTLNLVTGLHREDAPYSLWQKSYSFENLVIQHHASED